MPKKDNYKPSIMQDKCECYICHADYTAGLEHHHAIGGRNRKKSDEYALWVWLCRKCHRELHDFNLHEKEIQAAAQRAFIAHHKKIGYPEEICREEWFRQFGKYYD